MLVPAFFVASGAQAEKLRRQDNYDVIVVTGPHDTAEAHRLWLQGRGILHCDTMDLSALADVPVRQGRLTKATLFKLLLAGHFADRYEKILYLDADVAVRDGIGALFALDTGAFPLAAAPAGRLWAGLSAAEAADRETHFRALGMTAPYRYFNAGVLLIDTAKWNRERLEPRALQFIRDHPDLCALPDEDALNALLDGRIADLSPVWNMRGTSWVIRDIRKWVRAAIVHYDGPKKPWRLFARDKRLFENFAAYRDYAAFVRMTPWRGWLRTQWRWRDALSNVFFEYRHWSRRLRGKARPAVLARRGAVEEFLASCRTAPFADVDQGIVIRTGGGLYLAPRTPAPP